MADSNQQKKNKRIETIFNIVLLILFLFIARFEFLKLREASQYKDFLVFIEKGNYSGCRRIIKRVPFIVNKKDKNGIPPLHKAIYYSKPDIVELLVNNGADMNEYVRQERWLDFFKIPYSSCNLSAPPEKSLFGTPLYLSVLRNENGISKYLVKKGAVYKSKNSWGDPLLHKSVEKGNFEMVKFLLKEKGGVTSRNDDNETPLHIAIANDRTEIAKYLLKNGADCNARDFSQKTPLHLAIEKNKTDIVKLLIKKGADCRIKSGGLTPLHYAVLSNNTEIAELLIKNGADINYRPPKGDYKDLTPLGMSMKKNKEKMSRLLRKHGGKE